MLFKLSDQQLEPMKYLGVADVGKLEKDLENILSINMFDTLFDGSPFLVIFQERAWQPEPDIIALDRLGNTVIFELKRHIAGDDALGQLFRYVQDVYKWTYDTLENKVRKYMKNPSLDLADFHRGSFGLPSSLSMGDFNRHQKMVVVGQSADINLIDNIDYWKTLGIDVDFIPYRIYSLAGNHYFEFFAKPYDIHMNPAEVKGVMFDTNRTYDENALEYMLQHKRISAFGDRIAAIHVLRSDDYVFYSHRYVGLVAAGIVKGKVQASSYYGEPELYYDVDFQVTLPSDLKDLKAIGFNRVTELTHKTFFWARTDKRPYLTETESQLIVEEMRALYP